MTRWAVLPPYLVRVTGFAFERLAPLRCAEAIAADVALDAASTRRLAAGHALDTAIASTRYADNPALDDPAVRKVLSRHVKHVRAIAKRLDEGALPEDALSEVVRAIAQVAAQADELRASDAIWRDARRAYDATFAADFDRARAAIRSMYADDLRLQEAVFLESPDAFDRVQQLIASGGPRNARARQRERLAAMYAQRFCAKNDTNSFCGPHGLADATAPAGDRAEIAVVREDVRRETYFSHWAAERLLQAAVLRAGDAARVTFRIHPSARLDAAAVSWCVMDHDATTSFRRRYRRSDLPPAGARLIAELAHWRTRDELLALASELEFEPDEIIAFVEQLVDAGAVLRGPILAPGLFYPLRAVADELGKWPASDARTWALDEVAAIEQIVAEFARAPLARRLELDHQLVTRFVEATGDAATRNAGQHYADRSLLHEDCSIEVRAKLASVRAALDTVLPALFGVIEIPLERSRERVRDWFRARFGEGVAVPALEAHRAFDEDRVLDAPATTKHDAVLDRVRDVFARAAAASAGGPVRVSADELRATLAEIAAPSHSAYLSADLLLRRLPDGGVSAVVGEVHGFFWLPTCLLGVLPEEECERTVEQMRVAVRDMAHGRRTAECVFLHTQATDRRFALATTDLQLLVPSDRADAIDFGAMDLRLSGDEFEFTCNGEEVVPLVAYTSYPFILYTSRIAPMFDMFAERFFPDSLLPPVLRDGDAPRISVDDVVVQRRFWRRTAVSVRAALAATSEAELFRRGQAFRRELGCDACVYASLAGEPKPILLDFANVFLLEALVNLLERQADDAVVKISEMLPSPEELLTEAPDGLRTSELRMGFYRA